MSVNYILTDMWDGMADLGENSLAPYVPGGPWRPLSVVLVYLLFVLKVGPLFMKDRKPYDLSKVLQLFNLINIAANVYLLSVALYATRFGLDCFDCSGRSPYMFQVAMGYYYLKFFDLLDTVFFVLRKKQKQITTLHVSHHSIVPLCVWLGLKAYSQTPAALAITLNAFAHILTYGFYYAAAHPKLKQNLWWKKYITFYQIIQFNLILLQIVILVPKPCISTFHKFLSLVPTSFLLYMNYSFGKFYYHNYLKNKESNESNNNAVKKTT